MHPQVKVRARPPPRQSAVYPSPSKGTSPVAEPLTVRRHRRARLRRQRQVTPHDTAEQLRSAAHTKLPIHPFQMRMHRVARNAQRHPDRPVGTVGHHRLDHLPLPRRQPEPTGHRTPGLRRQPTLEFRLKNHAASTPLRPRPDIHHPSPPKSPPQLIIRTKPDIFLRLSPPSPAPPPPRTRFSSRTIEPSHGHDLSEVAPAGERNGSHAPNLDILANHA